jgi:hypothetical protein
VLCQLSYAHHRRRAARGLSTSMSIAVPGSGNDPDYFSGGMLPYFTAISRAVAESGPGCGTNTASR